MVRTEPVGLTVAMEPEAQHRDCAEWASRNLAEQVRHLELLALQLRGDLDTAAGETNMFRAAAEERLAALLETEGQRQAEIAAKTTVEAERQKLLEKLADRDREIVRLRAALAENEQLLRQASASERIVTQELVVLQNEGLLHLVVRKLRESLRD